MKQNRVFLFLSILCVGLFLFFLFVFFIASSKKDTNPSDFPLPTPIKIDDREVNPAPVEFENSTNGVSDQKPWVLGLPLKNPAYYVEYDSVHNMIKAYLYPMISFSLTKEYQINFLKEKVTKELTSLKVDLSKEKIEWIIEE